MTTAELFSETRRFLLKWRWNVNIQFDHLPLCFALEATTYSYFILWLDKGWHSSLNWDRKRDNNPNRPVYKEKTNSIRSHWPLASWRDGNLCLVTFSGTFLRAERGTICIFQTQLSISSQLLGLMWASMLWRRVVSSAADVKQAEIALSLFVFPKKNLNRMMFENVVF